MNTNAQLMFVTHGRFYSMMDPVKNVQIIHISKVINVRMTYATLDRFLILMVLAGIVMNLLILSQPREKLVSVITTSVSATRELHFQDNVRTVQPFQSLQMIRRHANTQFVVIIKSYSKMDHARHVKGTKES